MLSMAAHVLYGYSYGDAHVAGLSCCTIGRVGRLSYVMAQHPGGSEVALSAW